MPWGKRGRIERTARGRSLAGRSVRETTRVCCRKMREDVDRSTKKNARGLCSLKI